MNRAYITTTRNGQFQHALQLLHDFVVPEMQHDVALTSQPCVTLLILDGGVGMLTAIEFNHKATRHADKIDDGATDGFLPFEL